MKITTGHTSARSKANSKERLTLSVPAVPGILEQLHCIGSSTSLLRVPKDHSLRFDILLDQTCNGNTKGFLLVGTNPNEEPVNRGWSTPCVSIMGHRLTNLDFESKWTVPRRSNPSAGADPNATTGDYE
jgi:hypothetical protein